MRLLGLKGAEADALTEAYRERRLAHVAEALAALHQEPPRYAGLLEAAQALFADEDALALRFRGEEGRERLRAASLEARATFLGIAASMAEEPFDATHW